MRDFLCAIKREGRREERHKATRRRQKDRQTVGLTSGEMGSPVGELPPRGSSFDAVGRRSRMRRAEEKGKMPFRRSETPWAASPAK